MVRDGYGINYKSFFNLFPGNCILFPGERNQGLHHLGPVGACRKQKQPSSVVKGLGTSKASKSSCAGILHAVAETVKRNWVAGAADFGKEIPM
jgi:hypothetical protein